MTTDPYAKGYGDGIRAAIDWLNDHAAAMNDRQSRDLFTWAAQALGNRLTPPEAPPAVTPDKALEAELAPAAPVPVSRLILRLDDFRAVLDTFDVVGKAGARRLAGGRDPLARLIPAPEGFVLALRGQETLVPVVTGRLGAPCAVDADHVIGGLRSMVKMAPAIKDVAVRVTPEAVTLVCGALVVTWPVRSEA